MFCLGRWERAKRAEGVGCGPEGTVSLCLVKPEAVRIVLDKTERADARFVEDLLNAVSSEDACIEGVNPSEAC